jgi:hypothetical protein
MQNHRANFLIIAGCLAVAAAIEANLPAGLEQPAARVRDARISLPYHLGPYSGREAHGQDIRGYPGEIHRLYRQAGANAIELIAAPTANHHAPENCLPYMGWSIIQRGHRTLQSNPAIELQTVVAVSDNASEQPRACAYYWRRDNRATDNLLAQWLQQRRAAVTQSFENAELVSACTSMEDVRQAASALERVYNFANDFEPYFEDPTARLVGSATRPADGP